MKLQSLIKKKKRMGKRGALMDIIIWIVVAFVTLLFLGGFLFFFNLLTEELTGIESEPGDAVNISKAAEQTFGVMNVHMQQLHFIAFIIIFMLGFSILITNALIKANPVFFIVYILIVVVAILFAVEISNAYNDLLGDEVLGDTLQGFSGSNFIMDNLPVWVTIIGFVGAILLFAGIMKDRELQGGIT